MRPLLCLLFALALLLSSCAPRLQARADLSLLPPQFDNARFSTVCSSLILNREAVKETQSVIPEKIETNATGVGFDLIVRAGFWQVCATFSAEAEPGWFEGTLFLTIDGQSYNTALIVQVNP